MLFLVFTSQEERRVYGGSAFVEMQFCRLSCNTQLSDIVAINSIKHWRNDSLYISDVNVFYEKYSHIFDCGTYNNPERGIMDLYGINYYAPSQINSLIDRVRELKPIEHSVLIDWLERAKQYNGFYILGI